jgi:transcriptional regulator with XRE-family HTH domain
VIRDGLDGASRSYEVLVGDRLRLVRQQRHLTLQQVDEATGGEFKASVLGAYERGERIISVLRLKRLAELYRVPIDHLLPHTEQPLVAIDLTQAEGRPSDRRRAATENLQRPFASGRWPRRCSKR